MSPSNLISYYKLQSRRIITLYIVDMAECWRTVAHVHSFWTSESDLRHCRLNELNVSNKWRVLLTSIKQSVQETLPTSDQNFIHLVLAYGTTLQWDGVIYCAAPQRIWSSSNLLSVWMCNQLFNCATSTNATTLGTRRSGHIATLYCSHDNCSSDPDQEIQSMAKVAGESRPHSQDRCIAEV